MSNLFHCCIQKTASMWFTNFFSDSLMAQKTGMSYISPGKNYFSSKEVSFSDLIIPDNSIVGPLYIPYDAFITEAIKREYRAFFVYRDPRDYIISDYFSVMNSHSGKEIIAVREMYKKEFGKDVTEALKKIIYNFFEDKAGSFVYRFVPAWLEAADNNPNIKLFRYEDLFGSSSELFFNSLLNHLQIDISGDELRVLLEKYRFEIFSGGRSAGDENKNHHYRKGISGDWKNYFDDETKHIFKQKTGSLLQNLGYEKDQRW